MGIIFTILFTSIFLLLPALCVMDWCIAIYRHFSQKKNKCISPNPFPEFDEKPYISSYFESRRKVFEEAIEISGPKDSMALEEAYEYFLDAENLSNELNGLLKKSFDLCRVVKTIVHEEE